MIGPKTIAEAKEMIGRLLDDNLDLIDQAYAASEAGLTISLSVKIEEAKKPTYKYVEAGINFVVHRAKNQIAREVSEVQDQRRKKLPLFQIKNPLEGIQVTFIPTPENREIKE